MQSNRHAITCMDDFKGMTVRVQAGQMYADIYAALGASTASIPFGELYTAMQNGTVDVEDVGIATCYTNRYYEVEDYAVELNHCMCANYFMMSNACYDQLTEEEREWFMEGCVLAEKAAEEAVASGDANAYEEYAKAGVEVIRYDELDPADIQELKDATASVWDKYRDVVGADLYDTFVELATEMGLR
jgi:C4-dicarboxylate-binding protein DctP